MKILVGARTSFSLFVLTKKCNDRKGTTVDVILEVHYLD